MIFQRRKAPSFQSHFFELPVDVISSGLAPSGAANGCWVLPRLEFQETMEIPMKKGWNMVMKWEFQGDLMGKLSKIWFKRDDTGIRMG